MAEYSEKKGYGKRPLWQWLLIYLVIGLIVYGIIYYFVFAKKGGYTPPTGGSSLYPTSQQSQQSQPTQMPQTQNGY